MAPYPGRCLADPTSGRPTGDLDALPPRGVWNRAPCCGKAIERCIRMPGCSSVFSPIPVMPGRRTTPWLTGWSVCPWIHPQCPPLDGPLHPDLIPLGEIRFLVSLRDGGQQARHPHYPVCPRDSVQTSLAPSSGPGPFREIIILRAATLAVQDDQSGAAQSWGQGPDAGRGYPDRPGAGSLLDSPLLHDPWIRGGRRRATRVMIGAAYGMKDRPRRGHCPSCRSRCYRDRKRILATTLTWSPIGSSGSCKPWPDASVAATPTGMIR